MTLLRSLIRRYVADRWAEQGLAETCAWCSPFRLLATPRLIHRFNRRQSQSDCPKSRDEFGKTEIIARKGAFANFWPISVPPACAGRPIPRRSSAVLLQETLGIQRGHAARAGA